MCQISELAKTLRPRRRRRSPKNVAQFWLLLPLWTGSLHGASRTTLGKILYLATNFYSCQCIEKRS